MRTDWARGTQMGRGISTRFGTESLSEFSFGPSQIDLTFAGEPSEFQLKIGPGPPISSATSPRSRPPSEESSCKKLHLPLIDAVGGMD